MPIQRLFQYAGIAKQTAKGSAASSPTYGLPTRGGGLLQVELEQERDPLTWKDTYRAAYEVDRRGVNPAVELQTRAYLSSIGLLLYGALGAVTTTGTSPDYTHTFTAAATLPYLTAWTLLGSERAKVVDCKVDRLALSWTGRELLSLDVTLLGCTPSFGEPSWTPTTDEQTAERFRPVGGTLKLDAASGTPAAAKVSAGSVELRNNVSRVPLSDSVLAADVFENGLEVEVSLTVVPDDLAEWRKAVTGSASGTSASSAPVYGSVELTFQIASNKSLKLTLPRVAFAPSFPEGDPGGGPVELEMSGSALRTASAGPITAELKNQVASY